MKLIPGVQNITNSNILNSFVDSWVHISLKKDTRSLKNLRAKNAKKTTRNKWSISHFLEKFHKNPKYMWFLIAYWTYRFKFGPKIPSSFCMREVESHVQFCPLLLANWGIELSADYSAQQTSSSRCFVQIFIKFGWKLWPVKQKSPEEEKSKNTSSY